MNDAAAPKFGLPRSLQIPIAATGEPAISRFVGQVIATRKGRDGSPKAPLVRAYPRAEKLEPDVPLWSTDRGATLPRNPSADEARSRLHPQLECWVHVEYDGYRIAYFGFGLHASAGDFLDHVQNRRAMIGAGMRNLSHPWVRLCPVRRAVNTSGGALAGGEGMEKQFLAARATPLRVANQIIYADPMDLTKLLNLAPGTGNLDGVRVAQALF